MSAAQHFAHLRLQRAIVVDQLGRLTPEQRLMRVNLEGRLSQIDEVLAAAVLEDPILQRARVALTFGGKPVVEAGAIEAKFGADALQAFQRLVSMVAATREGRTLAPRGPIPDEDDYRLFITATFPGSFGFELEEVASSSPPAGVLRDALDEATRVLEATQADDEAYTVAVAESNPRVIAALADFLGLLESRQATLRVEAETRECRFETAEVVAAAAERARRTDIQEVQETVRGVLSGVTGRGRRFEFQVAKSDEIINGRISYNITDPSSLKPYLWTECVAHMKVVTVERAGKQQRAHYLTAVELPDDDDASPRQ